MSANEGHLEPAPLSLARIGRVLRYAVADDGIHLWRLSFLERTCRPALLRHAGMDPAVAAAADALKGVDGLPWTRRRDPIERALEALEAVDAPSSETGPEALEPVGELVRVPDLPMPQEEAEAPRSTGRRRRRRKEGVPSPRRAEAEAQKPEAPPPPPPPPPPRLPLGHPEGSGRSVETLPGASPLLGPLAAHDITTLADLLTLTPESTELVPIVQAEEPLPEQESAVAVSGLVKARWVRFGPTGRSDELALEQGDRTVRCRWLLGAPPEPPSVGSEVTLVGRLDLDEEAVLYEALAWWPDGRGNVCRPIYALEGVDEDSLRLLLRHALVTVRERLADPLPLALIQEARIPRLEDALFELHVPTGPGERGRSRLAFEDLFYFQLAIVGQQEVRLRGLQHTVSHGLLARLQQEENLTLDDSQEQVFDEIKRDLRRPHAMSRLLQGDVGSGKALIALSTAVLVMEAKSQVVFLAPDGIAAEHRFLFAERMLRALGLVGRLLVGKADAGLLDALKRGEVHALFATHRLLEDFPAFKKLGLVVVEERNNFRVVRREVLIQKGVHPDVLVISSVPIPTSLTFTAFSDHDVSVIKTGSQQHVRASVHAPADRAEVFEQVRTAIDAKSQAYMVFPMLEGRDIVPLANARQLVDALAAEAFGGARLALYHSAMSREERGRVFEDFQHRRIDVLVATTAIEDAPEIENATVMVVENADRYDRVRLHRLRGHVAQGRGEGRCFFVLSESPDPGGRQLVERLCAEQDGFVIAEQDREARGDEALLGERSEALPSFPVADTSRDRALLLRARRAALRLLQVDPGLKQRVHRGIAEGVAHRYPELVSPGAEGDPAEPGSRRRRRRRRRK